MMGRREKGGGEMEREIEIGDGSEADYAGLAHLHYRAGMPAVVERVLVARWRVSAGMSGRVIGVLVVARPTLNGAWRARAWPEEFGGGASARERAVRCAALVRAIARLVVVPRVRGMGVGRALVERAVAERSTEYLEAVTAMGWSSPVFARAGMRVVEEEEPAHVARLRARLGEMGIGGSDLVWMACPTCFMARFMGLGMSRPMSRVGSRVGEEVSRRAEVERALAVWADASSATRKEKKAGVMTLLPRAAQALVGRRVFVV